MKFLNKNKKTFAHIIFLIIFVSMVALPFISFAACPPDCGTQTEEAGNTTITNPLKNVNTINGLIKIILEGVIKIGIPIIALALVYSGFLFVSAVGKPDKLKEAKDAFLYTLIGAAILLGSWAIAQLISETVLQL
ncbi:MAG: hypothetical protein AAB636_02200 [Patescibacteria group bacterium]